MARDFPFSIFLNVCRHLVALPWDGLSQGLPYLHRRINTWSNINIHSQRGLKPIIPVSERHKTMHAIDRASALTL